MKCTTRLTILMLLVLLILPLVPVSSQNDPVSLTEELLADFTTYVENAVERWRIPGAAVVVVQDGEIVYAEGFGVRELGKDDLVTPDTLFVMGSMTKSMTDIMVATLVDDGILDWDTLAVEIWPDFQLADPDTTANVTVRDLLSMRAGLREDGSAEGSLWRGRALSAEELLVAMAQDPLVGQPGEAFNYDNMGIAAGAYLGALAEGGEYGDLFNAYADLMQARVFDPIGMTNATARMDIEMIREKIHPDLAWPHLWNEAGQHLPADIFLEGSVSGVGIIPAGGAAASANDVARYLITHLNQGLSPDGDRVVSTENLTEMWTPQISIGPDVFERIYIPTSFFVPGDAQLDYGIGWFLGTYEGVQVVTDPGDERGYTNLMALLPETNTGIGILTNGEGAPCARVMTLAVQYRLVELLYGLENQIDGYVDTILEMFGVECPAPTAQTALEGLVYEDPQGRFSIPLIGDWTQVETDGTYARFAFAEPPLDMYVATVESDDLEAGVDEALRQVGVDPAALTLTQAGNTLGLWFVFFYSLGDSQGVAVLAQVRDEATYAIIATGDEDVVVRAEPPGDVLDTIDGFTFAGQEVVLPTTVEAFEAYINSFVGDIPPGLSIAIALGDDVIYANGFGLADGPKGMAATPDTVYQWGSMAKMVTATAVLQLRDQGLIDLDAHISDYLDYFPAQYPITVRQLLTHSAGFPEGVVALELFNVDGAPLPDPDQGARKYVEQFTGPIFEPGSISAYSNPHLLLLGQVVAEVSGQSYIEYAQENILTPLGMENTDFTYSSEAMIANAAAHAIPAGLAEELIATVDEVWKLGDTADLIREIDDQYAWLSRLNLLAAWGGLKGSPTDAIRFLQMHLNNGELDGVRILSPESAAMMREVQLSTSGDPLEFTLGWRIGEDAEHPYVEHAGGGQGIKDLMRLYPNEGIAIVLMSNAAGYDELAVMNAAANVVFTMMAGQ